MARLNFTLNYTDLNHWYCSSSHFRPHESFFRYSLINETRYLALRYLSRLDEKLNLSIEHQLLFRYYSKIIRKFSFRIDFRSWFRSVRGKNVKVGGEGENFARVVDDTSAVARCELDRLSSRQTRCAEFTAHRACMRARHNHCNFTDFLFLSPPGKVTCAAWIFIYVDYYSVILILCAIFRHFEGPGKKFMSTWITVNERRIMEVVWPRVNMIDRCILSVINIVILLSLFCAPYILRMFHNFFENCKKIQIYLSTSVVCNFTVLLYLLIRKIRVCESLSIRIIFIKKNYINNF